MERSYPAHWEADVLLRDGGTAHLRPVTADDGAAILEFHGRLSEETIYFRYFTPKRELTAKDLFQLTHVDHDRRVALLMTLAGEVIAVGRYEAISASQAEVAFTVRDDHQSRGIGSVLLEHLAAAARERGFRRFVGEVLPENHRMLDVFTEAGYTAARHFEDGVVSVSIDLEQTAQAIRVMEAREHRAEARSIQRILTPRSVALVGVSAREGTFGHTLLSNLVGSGFTGDIHVVHPTATEIGGIEAYPSISHVPGEVDLAVIAVRADAVLDVVRECGEKGAQGVVVISSGFAEVGATGRERQRDLVHVARGRGMRVVGPNCLGIINTAPESRLNASLAPTMPPAGRLGFFSQSGALGIALLDTVARRDLGVSTFVSAGNRADVSGNDMLQYWEADDATDVVLLYLESIGNPRKFTRLARRIARSKPIVAMKTGRSTQGRPLGHTVRTTSLPVAAVDEMFRQSGVIQTDTLNHLFDVSQVLAFQPLPDGDRIGIVGNSDALGLLAMDAAQARSLTVVGDPVNLGTDATAAEFARALAGVLEDPAVDTVLAVFVPPLSAAGAGAVEAIAAAAARATKPVIATVVGSDIGTELLVRRDLNGTPMRGSVPAFDSVEEAVRAIAAVTDYADWRRRPLGTFPEFDDVDHVRASALVADFVAHHPDGADLPQARLAELLACFGIALWPSITVDDEDQAIAAATELGFPVGLRRQVPDVAGRAVAGSVRLNLESEAAVRTGFRRLRQREGADHAITIQRMSPPGIDCVVASTEDALFGPVVSFGLSGVATELLGDRAYRIPPLTDVDAADLVRTPRAAPLLTGFGGSDPVDLAALEDLLLRVSLLGDAHPEVAELVLDPVTVNSQGLVVMGARARIAVPLARSEADVRRLND